VPKRGYRFVSPVEASLPDEPESPPPATVPRSGTGRWRVLATVAAAIVVVLVAAGIAALRHARATPSIRSLAVLPLKNLSGDTSQDYFAAGVTELLTDELSRRLPFRVVSRTSAALYGGTPQSGPTIRSELGVDALIEGSVVRSGDRVRITVRLVATSGRQIWTESYDRDVSDMLMFQEEIARAVASQIRSKVLRGEVHSPSIARASFNAYLRARHYWNRRTAESVNIAIRWFQKAIDEDPLNARAYAGLADCYNQLGTVMIGAGSPQKTRKLALAAANRALEIDPNLAEAHATLGYVAMYEWQWQRAQTELNRAIHLNPNYPTAHLWLGHYYSMHGRHLEALQEVRLAGDLDPLSPIIEAQHGWLLIHARRYAEALGVLRGVVANTPDYQWALWQLGIGTAHEGNPAAALAILEPAAASHRTHAFLGSLGYAYGRASRRTDALRVLEELTSASRRGYVSPHALMFVHIGLGDRDRAFECLEQSFAERSNGVAWMAVAPDFDPLRPDPRFDLLLARTGLPSGLVPREQIRY
jgi:TolB-like protein/Tfp pilus assembly protein PilF